MKIMRKIFKPFKKLFKGIYKLIDAIIIVPLSKLLYFILDKITGTKSKSLDKLMNNKNTLIIVSLLIAFGLYFSIDSGTLNLVATESTVLTAQEINIEYNEEAYVLEGIPESADIVLMGSKSNLYLAEQLSSSHKLSIDLSDLGEGTHKVSLKYNNPIKALDYKVDPSTVTVVIKPKVSESRTLSKDILNTDKLDEKLVISSVTLDKDEVIIKSYKEKLATVANVKAIIDVNALNCSSAGTYTLDKVKLVAYDEKGTEIPNIEIIPGSVSATVIVTSPSKEVPIKIVPDGEVASGSAISAITPSLNSVTIYGEESVINEINEISVKIDVNGLNEDKTFKENITKPAGTRGISDSVITIKVEMQTEISKEFENVPIRFENLDTNKYKALASNESSTKVNVVVKGTSALLEKLTVDDIKAYVDLGSLTEEGSYEVPIVVTGSDLKLSYSSRTTKITIKIQKK